MGEFPMPSLGAEMDAGTVLKWLIEPGAPVCRGQVIAVVDTAGAAIEIESSEGGVLEEIIVTPGHQVPVGAPLARISVGRPPALRSSKRGSFARVGHGRVRPRARLLAPDLEIDLTEVIGSGASGAVPTRDLAGLSRPRVMQAAGTDGATSQARALQDRPANQGRVARPAIEAQRVLASGLAPGGTTTATGAATKAAKRAAIADLLAQPDAQLPQYYVSQTVDLATALAWLAEHNAGLPAAKRVLSAAVLLRATMLAATAVPDLNAHWVNGRARRAHHIDVGVTVATRAGGLVTPALPDVGDLRIDDLMAAFAALVDRARRGMLRRSDMAGASITVSSVGETGPDAVTGAICPPQVALVGVGGIVHPPHEVNGMMTAHPSVTITLAADHRATDGRIAADFVGQLDRALQNPQEL